MDTQTTLEQGLQNFSSLKESTSDGARLIIESALTWCSQQYGQDRIIYEFEQFAKDFGKAFHDDPFYESRLAYFHDVFLLSPSNQEDSTPRFDRFLNSKPLLPRIVMSHAVFEILRHFPTTLQCQNIFTKQKITVDARTGETFAGLSSRDILQGHIYQDKSGYFLSFGVIVHPSQVRAMIKKEVATAVKEKLALDELLSSLARRNLKHLRHRNVDPKNIYALEL